MVSSYLICDACGRFGPPAGFLSENGLRLCYQCWYQERQDDRPDADASGERTPTSNSGFRPADGIDARPKPG